MSFLFPLQKSLSLSAVFAALMLGGCASTLPGQGTVPAAADVWSKPGATRQDTEQALQACGYVDRFSIGTSAIARQFACMIDKGYQFNVDGRFTRAHCVAPEMPAGCASYWHTLDR